MTRNIVRAAKSLDLILVRGSRKLDSHDEIPSWSPDWLKLADPRAQLELSYVYPTAGARKFKADGDQILLLDQSKPSGRILYTEGSILGVIDGLSSVYGTRPSSSSGAVTPDTMMQSTQADGDPYSKSDLSHAPGSATAEVILRRLAVGCTLDNSRRDAWDGSEASYCLRLYTGVDSSWLGAYRGKRCCSTRKLSSWLCQNKDLLINGRTFESLCNVGWGTFGLQPAAVVFLPFLWMIVALVVLVALLYFAIKGQRSGASWWHVPLFAVAGAIFAMSAVLSAFFMP